MKKLETLAARMAKTRELLKTLEAEYEELRLVQIRKVEYTKNDKTGAYALSFNGRKLNAAFGTWGRLKVTENRKVIVPEFWGGIHDLRFEIALGNV